MPLGHIHVSLGHILVSLGHILVSLGPMLAPLGHTLVSLGYILFSLGHILAFLGHTCLSRTRPFRAPTLVDIATLNLSVSNGIRAMSGCALGRELWPFQI